MGPGSSGLEVSVRAELADTSRTLANGDACVTHATHADRIFRAYAEH